jgi:hypothetical protein
MRAILMAKLAKKRSWQRVDQLQIQAEAAA